jgi:hypothetical protein
MSLWLRKRVKKHDAGMQDYPIGTGLVHVSPPASMLVALHARIGLFFLFFTTLCYMFILPLMLYQSYYSWWFAMVTGFILSTPLWVDGGGGWKAFGKTAGFEAWRRYFEFSVYKEERFKQNTNIMMAIAPHGLFPLALPMLHGICDAVFPEFEGRVPNTAIANAMFYAPVISPLLSWLHCVSATRDSISRALQTNNCVILPDGIAGAFHSHGQREQVYLESRLGFVKTAMAEGSLLVPGYCFGHTQLFDVYPSEKSWLARLSRRLRFSIVFFVGERWLPPLPKRVPLLLVFGKGIQVDRNTSPTVEQMREVHDKYKAELSRIYYEHRQKVPGYETKDVCFL